MRNWFKKLGASSIHALVPYRANGVGVIPPRPLYIEPSRPSILLLLTLMVLSWADYLRATTYFVDYVQGSVDVYFIEPKGLVLLREFYPQLDMDEVTTKMERVSSEPTPSTVPHRMVESPGVGTPKVFHHHSI